MARIQTTERHGRYFVTVEGALRASDLRRLEHVCGTALEQESAPLVILLHSEVQDPVAKAYVDRLQIRGAAVRRAHVSGASRASSDSGGRPARKTEVGIIHKEDVMTSPRILVATDLSQASALALREADARTTQGGALLVCHILPSWPRVNALFPQLGVPTPEDPATRERQAGEAVTMLVTQATGRGPDNYTMTIETGDPVGAIIRRAESWNADLVVVGSLGVTALSRMRLGSVAERVVRLAPCPVLVVRPSTGTDMVIAGTDFSDAALPALQAAGQEALRRHGRVTFLHSVEWGYVADAQIGGGGMVVLDPPKELAQEALGRLEMSLTTSGASGECRVTYGEAGRALVREAEASRADLLVVGTHGRTGISRIMLGSVAEFVVRTAPCSVLVVRLNGRE